MAKLINLQLRSKLHCTKRTFSYYGANNTLLEAAAGLGQSNHCAAAWPGAAWGNPGVQAGTPPALWNTYTGSNTQLAQTSFISVQFLNH